MTSKAILWGLILLFYTSKVKAQSFSTLEIIKADTVFTIDSTYWDLYPDNLLFGGISGMERLEDGRLLLVSDRQTPSKLEENQYSWAFLLNPENSQVELTFRFFGMKNVEALRIHDDRFWFSFEDEHETGIGFIDSEGYPVIVAQHSMIDGPFTMDNRGIESISVGKNLWYAFESGRSATWFVLWPELNKHREQWFEYPLNKRSCLQDEQPLNGSLGNGVTDILVIPETSDHLLVMERCFNGRFTYVRLFEAWLNQGMFDKRELFSWDPETQFMGKTIKPDNMEGLTWGEPDTDGRRTLYIISDDNHNPRFQRTILLKLREQKE